MLHVGIGGHCGVCVPNFPKFEVSAPSQLTKVSFATYRTYTKEFP